MPETATCHTCGEPCTHPLCATCWAKATERLGREALYKRLPGWPSEHQDALYRRFLDEKCGIYKAGHFVELGVYHGRGIAYLLHHLGDRCCYVVGFDDGSLAGTKRIFLNELEESLNAEAELQPGVATVNLWGEDSAIGAQMFDDESVDFVFLDTLHTFEQVDAEIKAWLPKVKRGGWIGGHDFTSGFPGVEHAVRHNFGSDFEIHGDCWLAVKK